MAYDYKKEEKALYQPKTTPSAIEIPPMNFLAVRGQGDPNQEGGAYKTAVGLLFGLAYTIKMSKKGDHAIPGKSEKEVGLLPSGVLLLSRGAVRPMYAPGAL